MVIEAAQVGKPSELSDLSGGRIEILPTGPGTQKVQSNQRGSFQTFCLGQILSWLPGTPTFQHPFESDSWAWPRHPFHGLLYTYMASSTVLTLFYHVVSTNSFTLFFD